MWKPLRYYRAKAQLAGLFTVLPSALLALALCAVVISFAERNVTPKSVAVSSYTRLNGTHVEGYYRRPSGAVLHDQPSTPSVRSAHSALSSASALRLALSGASVAQDHRTSCRHSRIE